MSAELALGVIPIIRMRGLLLVPIQVPPSDSQARQLLQDLLEAIISTGAKNLIVDVSSLEVIDSYLTRIFYDVVSAAGKLGARAAIVGIRPAVAITLVQMGITSFSVDTFLNLDDALEKLGR
jgi:rsbT antagonist protein RsbS